MHLELNRVGRIETVHVEYWDRISLMTHAEKLEEFRHARIEDFLYYLLKHRLFLRIRNLFWSEKKRSLFGLIERCISYVFLWGPYRELLDQGKEEMLKKGLSPKPPKSLDEAVEIIQHAAPDFVDYRDLVERRVVVSLSDKKDEGKYLLFDLGAFCIFPFKWIKEERIEITLSGARKIAEEFWMGRNLSPAIVVIEQDRWVKRPISLKQDMVIAQRKHPNPLLFEVKIFPARKFKPKGWRAWAYFPATKKWKK